MATAKPPTLTSNSRPPRRRGRTALLVLVAIALALLAWYRAPLLGRAQAGASFGARIACSCRFVAGRELSSCRDDFEPGMALVMLSEDAAAKSVTARFPLLASQTARLQPGAGCVLEPWDD